ncbi:PAS domain-containing protein [Temperatibacter marinus]|uniref:PAS domain-containing protein n=1 Tax=Temperatibacter marinus TaxID=1456591 RepID=A0AA52EF85_9PROT|nr:PAS domain-containing protein [Temperatibacter marinus]WND01437.1 PAS domain-containing protein [Temperatibacter marinus]
MMPRATTMNFSEADIPFEDGLALYRWWHTLFRKNGKFPRKSEINPSDHVSYLDKIYLITLDLESGDHIMRLHGTFITEIHQRDNSGKPVRLMAGADVFNQRIACIIEHKKPVLVTYDKLEAHHDAYDTYHTIGLPIADDHSGELAHIIGVVHYK